MVSRFALFFLPFVLLGWASAPDPQICHGITWNDDYGTHPLQPYVGNVTMVTLMKADCGYCINQAYLMDHLYRRLLSIIPGINLKMIIINGGENSSRDEIHELTSVVSFPVIQDFSDNYLYDQVFVGRKDHVFIYDRCGQRAYTIPSPYSNFYGGLPQRLLMRTLLGRHNCYCNLDPRRGAHRDPHNTMYGDAPSASNGAGDLYSTAALYNFMQCEESDIVCQRFRNIFRRLNSNNGIGTNMNSNLPYIGMFTDQSDFNLGNAAQGYSHSDTMGQMESGYLQRRGRLLRRRGGRRMGRPFNQRQRNNHFHMNSIGM